MKNATRILILLCLALVSVETFSQNVLDGAYIKENTPKRRVIPYTFLREADVI